MFIIPLFIYIALCLLVAYRGRQTKLGLFGCFLLSVILTPVLVFLGLILMEPDVDEVYRK